MTTERHVIRLADASPAQVDLIRALLAQKLGTVASELPTVPKPEVVRHARTLRTPA